MIVSESSKRSILHPEEHEDRMTAASSPANNLTDVLDRVLDKGIVIEAWISNGLFGLECVVSSPWRLKLVSADVEVSYGESSAEREQRLQLEKMKELFPFWRRDLWTK